MITSSTSFRNPSSTVSENVSGVSAVTDGPLNVGLTVFAPVSVTGSPPVCTHEYVRSSPFGSNEPLPSSVTCICSSGVWSAPALAIGAALSKIFVIVQTADSFTCNVIVLVSTDAPPLIEQLNRSPFVAV